MNKNSNFDKSGFLFFFKFATFISLLIVSAHFGSQAFADSLFPTEYNTANVDTILDEFAYKRQLQLEDEIILGFVGDIMLSRKIESDVMTYDDGNFSFPFEFIKDHLAEYDALFGNLEGPISDKGNDLGSIYSFRMNPEVAGVLKEIGFNTLSVANNHIGDWGDEAIVDTFLRLKDEEILYSGGGLNEEKAYSPRIININNTKIAYISFSQFGKNYLEAKGNNIGIAIISDEKLKEAISKAKEESDIIIVSFHFGDEYTTEPNSYQKMFSKKAIDYGADLVVGHHPHIVQPVVKYKDGYIAYSLGNFIFDQNLDDEIGTKDGLILKAVIKNGEIYEIEEIKIKFNYFFQPYLVDWIY